MRQLFEFFWIQAISRLWYHFYLFIYFFFFLLLFYFIFFSPLVGLSLTSMILFCPCSFSLILIIFSFFSFVFNNSSIYLFTSLTGLCSWEILFYFDAHVVNLLCKGVCQFSYRYLYLLSGIFLVSLLCKGAHYYYRAILGCCICCLFMSSLLLKGVCLSHYFSFNKRGGRGEVVFWLFA